MRARLAGLIVERMTDRNHQTVRLSGGKHASPEQGACVVELASMLAGEPFSDHPKSVCPVVAAFLRCYNDLAGDQRQDLLRCAADAVGTRLGPEAEHERLELCLAALADIGEVERSRVDRWVFKRSPDRLRQLVADEMVTEDALDRFAHGLARSLRREGAEGHRRAMRLVDDLVAVGRVPSGQPPEPARVPAAHAPF
jgi:hypothetical protein